MHILITGSNGLLGQKIVGQLLKKGLKFTATSRGDNRNPNCSATNYRSLDITSKKEIDVLLKELNPTAVINTAAMTNVDACEKAFEACELLNVTATKYLWETCKEIGAHFQLLSTDFIFDGEKGNYSEEDTANPLSVYGKSKYDAEQLLKTDANSNWSILRTIIILGITPNMSRSNILLWAKGALEKGEPLTIVDDQFRAPTWADDLAYACIETVKREEKGIFNISGPETLSVLEIVKRVGDYYKLDNSLITPIKSSSLNQAAKRPPKTGFNISKAKTRLNYKPKTLEEILELMENEVKQ